MLEKTLESPLYCKEIQPVHPKGWTEYSLEGLNIHWNPWIFIGRADTEAEIPILWPPDAKNWLTGKDPDAGKDWRQEEKGTTEDEMVGRLVAYSPKGHKELDMTEQLSTHTHAHAHTHTHTHAHTHDYLISSFSLYIWNLFKACSLLLTFH